MSAPTGLILTPPFDPTPYIETYDSQFIASGLAMGANTGFFHAVPIRQTRLLIAKFRIFVVATGNNVDVGLYRLDGTNLVLLTSSGSTVVGGNNTVQAIDPLAVAYVEPGVQYYLGMAADNATPTFGRKTSAHAAISAMGPVVRHGSKASSFPLASNAATVDTTALTTSTQHYFVRASAT